MIDAVAYARFSSDEQRQESITAQIRAIKYYADSAGYNIVRVYSDEAKSGRTANRPQFLRMIDDSRSGNFRTVFVHKYDRFARDAGDAHFYERALRLNGVEVVSVVEKLDNSPEGQLMKQVIYGMNAFYSANLAREVMKGLKENAYQCRSTGGIPPLGYDLGPDKRYIVNPQEAEAVKLLFEMYASGYSYGAIIDALNTAGHKTKAGRPFGRNSLYELLRNEKYAGVYVFNRSAERTAKGTYNRHKYKEDEDIIKIEDGIPQIVSKDLFEAAMKRMEQNRRQKAMHKARIIYLGATE